MAGGQFDSNMNQGKYDRLKDMTEFMTDKVMYDWQV